MPALYRWHMSANHIRKQFRSRRKEKVQERQHVFLQVRLSKEQPVFGQVRLRNEPQYAWRSDTVEERILGDKVPVVFGLKHLNHLLLTFKS